MLKVVTKIIKKGVFLFSFRFQSVKGQKHFKALNVYLNKTNVFIVIGTFSVNFCNSFKIYHLV